jgi:hypothetical protein
VLSILNKFCYIIFASIVGKWIDVRMGVRRNQFFFRCAVKDLLSDANMSQPHFEASVKMKFTPPKGGIWSPSGLLKTQSLIVEVKTPCIGMFFMSLERS